ncbi:restriction endonuclease subunit S [Methylobacter sp. Wu1]|uniref:restriction endonuclease subunit S n=1 Tax=Methylobacter sp. Wu1 TaxID=3119359 RepID=UPI002F91D441
MSNELPQGWIEATINEINLHKSQNITPSDFPEEEFELFSVPIFPTGKPENLLGKDIGSSKQVVSPGDVLLCKINPRINRVWTVGEKANLRQIASSEWINIRNPLICANYLKYAFSKKDFRELLCSEVAGVGGSLTRAQPKKVEKYTVPIAPLNEQIRIADKLDSVLAKVDAAQARLEKIPTLLKRFRQSVLAAATSGELTREWRVQNGIGLTDWKQTIFSEISREITVGFVGKMSDKYQELGVKFLRSQNVRAFRFNPENLLYISEDFHKEIYKSRLEAGDLAIVRSGAPGTTCVIPEELGDANCSDLVIVRPNDQLLPEYGCVYMNSSVAQQNVIANQVGVAQQHFNVGSMKNMPISLPSIPEQQEIVRRVESLFTLADTVEKQYLETKKRLDRLTQSLLAKAFRGELVPQDPNDEPAAELLKRIQAERNAQPPVKNKRSKPA